MPKFHAHIRDGKLEIIESEKFSKYLRNKVGDLISIDLEKVRSNRSIEQNKYYWGVVIALLSDYLGYTSEEIHEILRTNFLTERVRMKHDRRKKITMTHSTTTLNTLEFENYLESVRTWAMRELQVLIPLPNENKNQ